MTETNTEPVATVDSRGTACPGPLMDLIGKIRDLESGDLVVLLSDNDQSLTDVREWTEDAGNELLAPELASGEVRVTLVNDDADHVYAIGDTADTGVPNAGSVAHYQAGVVGQRLANEIRGRQPTATYDGKTLCFIETGMDDASSGESQRPGR